MEDQSRRDDDVAVASQSFLISVFHTFEVHQRHHHHHHHQIQCRHPGNHSTYLLVYPFYFTTPWYLLLLVTMNCKRRNVGAMSILFWIFPICQLTTLPTQLPPPAASLPWPRRLRLFQMKIFIDAISRGE